MAIKQLSLALIKAKELKIQSICISCDLANIASATVIENNVGILAWEGIYESLNKSISRYYIEIDKAMKNGTNNPSIDE